jgi:hypothetical protein
VLLSNSSLISLRLTHCTIPPSEVAALLKCLTKNTTLRTLDLSCNPQLFNNESTTLAISHALPHMKGLQSLKVCSTSLPSAALNGIFEGLRRNKTLVSFDVSENRGIGLELADCLIQSLAHLNVLQILLVHSTGLSDVLDQRPELVANLSSAMAKNTSLWKLDHIILHHVEQYGSEDERAKQRRCLLLLNEIEWYKVRNGLFSCNTLTLNKRALWSSILARAGTSGAFSADLAFCILQAKCDSIFLAKRPSEPAKSCGSKWYATTKSTRPVKANRRKKHSVQPSNRHGGSSGFSCKIHLRTKMIPANCCPFESITPITAPPRTAPYRTPFL